MSWIPARDTHLPDPDTDVLVVLRDDHDTWVDTAYLASSDGNWRTAGSHILIVARVLLWQPYPEVPDDIDIGIFQAVSDAPELMRASSAGGVLDGRNRTTTGAIGQP